MFIYKKLSLLVGDECGLLLPGGQLEGQRQAHGPPLQRRVEAQRHAVHRVHYQHEQRLGPANNYAR